MKRSKRGFTLIEMVVSMAVLGLVSFFLTEMLVRSSRTYTVVDDVTEAQQNLRAVTTLLERELRSTGFLVPAGAAICGWDTGGAAGPDTSPDVLYVSDADAIDPAGVSSPQGVKVDGATPAAPARTTCSSLRWCWRTPRMPPTTSTATV